MGQLNKLRLLMNRSVEIFCIIIVIVMVTVVTAQVFWRYVLSDSLSWSEELARYLFIWLTFLGAEVTLRRGGHVAFNSIVDLFKGIPNLIARVIIDLIIIVFSIIVFVSGWQLTAAAWNTPSAALGIIMSYVYIVIPITMALVIMNTTVVMVQRIKNETKENKSIDEVNY